MNIGWILQTPKAEIFVMIKMLIGTLIAFIFGCIFFGCQECGKIVIDKLKKG